MSVFATDSNRISTVVKYELEPSYGVCRDVVTVNDAAQTYKVGAVLGKVTAGGKYKLQDAAAVDGSQIAAAIFLGGAAPSNFGDTIIVATTDTPVLVMTRGPAIVAMGTLSFGAGTSTAPQKLAVYTSLRALGIQVEATV